jgi:hypothetical protein
MRGRVTNRVAIVEAVVVRDICIGLAPLAISDRLLCDAEVRADLYDADGARRVVHDLNVHSLTFRYPQGIRPGSRLQ